VGVRSPGGGDGVPGPIELRTEVAIPPGTTLPEGAGGKVVFHNDPTIDASKGWPWEHARRFVDLIGPERVVLLGNPGPSIGGTLDLRGRTTLSEAASVIHAAACYVGIDSGLMWIAGSLQTPTVGLYGTSYLPAYEAIQPANENATYLQAEGSLGSISAEEVQDRVRQRVGG
jgi:ADP-heptose:LPS heptosyltransferase